MQIQEHRPAIERRAAVMRRTGLTSSTLYRQIAAGKFPAPVKITPDLSGWLSSEVDDWIAARIAVRDGRAAQ